MKEQPLDAIIRGCQEEAARQDRASEQGYCFELFRRALEEREDDAWAAIHLQYSRLALQWCYTYNPESGQEEAEDIVREALERFWRTLRLVQITEKFEHVGALLKYLNQCVISTVQDHRRSEERRKRLFERLSLMEAARPPRASPEQEALDRMFWNEQIAQVRAWVAEHVSDDQELIVLKESFQNGLKPSEIARRYPQFFADAQAVFRIKERIIKRMRRALSH
ncbi:MAG: sigma-70 family RNA polymerase sigma factor [Chloroflexaceae bacterium]|nr:sigma-70 family RNA polymerase sigma factor [Chloroflexaceae bacterium]